MVSADEAAFIDRIREDHADDLPRLIYADWLDDRGDHPRADFIRVQCALAKMPHDDPAAEKLREYETQLTDAHAAEWGRDVQELVEGFAFRRGLIEAVTVKPGQMPGLREAVFARHPIRRLRLLDPTANPAKVFQSPVMRFVAELDMSGFPLDTTTGAAVARAKHLRNLESLDLGYTGVSPGPFATVIRSPAVARLKTLRLNGNAPLAAEIMTTVVAAKSLESLETLDLSDNLLTARNLDPLWTLFDEHDGLRRLNLCGNRLGDGFRILVNKSLLATMVRHDSHLDLTANEIGPGVEVLPDRPWFADVRALTLNDNPIRDAGLTAVARSENAGRLSKLFLVKCGLSDESVRFLANSPLMGRLVELDVRENLVTQEAVDRLTEMSRRKLKAGTLRIRADANLPKARPAMPTLRAFLLRPPG